MAGSNKQTKTKVLERDLSSADPLPAAFEDYRPAAPLAVRPLRRSDAEPRTGPAYPRVSTSPARRAARTELARRETTPGAGVQDDACCCECPEGNEEPFGDSPGGHVPHRPGWDDGRRGWDPTCVQRAKERLGLRELPDAVTARLGRVLGPAGAGALGAHAEGAEPRLADRGGDHGTTARAVRALPPPTSEEPDDA